MVDAVVIASVVGAAVLLVVVVALVLLLVWYLRRRRRMSSEYIRIAIDESLNKSVPKGYTEEEKQDDALMKVRFYLRDSSYDLDRVLPQIGHRQQKYSFLVKGSQKLILTAHAKGEACTLPLQSLGTRQTIKEAAMGLRHPFILPVLHLDFLPGSNDVMLVFRPFIPKGSVKDLIYQTKPERAYEQKYPLNKRGLPVKGTPLALDKVRLYGRQVLEAMQFMELHKYPCRHLHSANVMVSRNVCLLSEYENIFAGHRPLHADFTSNQTPLKDFGVLLFEMACGFEPTRKHIKHPPEHCPEEVAEIVQTIFLVKDPQPVSIDDVIVHPFFDVPVRGLTDEAGDETDIPKAASELLAAIEAGIEVKPKRRKKPTAPRATSAATGSQSSASSASSMGTSASRWGSSPASAQSPAPVASNVPAPPSAPPAPPSAPPPPPAGSVPKEVTSTGRVNLMASIRKGNKLKKAKTNDRSQPLV